MKSENAARNVSPAPDTRRRVVLIEDDSDISEAIGVPPGQDRFPGSGGTDGKRAGGGASRRRSRALDLNLPGMDGLEACRMIRRQETTAHVPIIMVTARADEVDRILGLEMGRTTTS